MHLEEGDKVRSGISKRPGGHLPQSTQKNCTCPVARPSPSWTLSLESSISENLRAQQLRKEKGKGRRRKKLSHETREHSKWTVMRTGVG